MGWKFNDLLHEEATQDALKMLLEKNLNEELERVVGCKRCERSPNGTGYLHGGYTRTLGTTVGTISFGMPRPARA